MTEDGRVQIETALDRARAARGRGALQEARDALVQTEALAKTLAPDHPLRQLLAWRTAKLDHDLGDPVAAVGGLSDLLDTDTDPFEHYEAGLRACVSLARGWWDVAGYGSAQVDQLLRRAAAGHRTRHDEVAARHVEVQLAWDHACAGAVDALSATLDAFARLEARQLDGGPTRHLRAADAATSAPWLQLDLARTVLRASAWGRNDALVDAAEDVFEGAADDAGIDRLQEFWFLEPLAIARQRLDRPDPDDYAAAWRDLAPRLDHPRAGYHRAIARAATEGRAAAAATLTDAARQARAGHFGPEWEIDPAIEAARLTGAWPEAAAARVRSHGVHVFADVLASLPPPSS